MVSPEVLRQLGAVGYALLGGFVFARSPPAAIALWAGAVLMMPTVRSSLEARFDREVDPWKLFAVSTGLAIVGVGIWLVG